MIFDCLEQCDRIRRKEANAASATDAQGWTSILLAFAKEGTQLDPRDLLPYPDDARDINDRRISRRTAKMLLQLEREGKLSDRFLAEAGRFIEEAKRYQ